MKTLLRLGGLRTRWIGATFLFLALAVAPALAVNSGNVRNLCLWIDGIETELIPRWEGGDPRIRYESTGTGALVPVGVDIAPLVVTCVVAPSPILQSLIKEFCARATTTHQLVVSEVNLESPPSEWAVVTRHYQNARIVEVHFTLRTVEEVTPRVRITFQADSVVTLPLRHPSAAPAAGTKAHWAMFDYMGEHVELLVPASGPAKMTGRLPAYSRFAHWAWRDAITGSNTSQPPTAQPKSFAASFNAGPSSETKFGFALAFTGAHLVRFTRNSTATVDPRTAELELLIERVVVTTEADAAAATPRTAVPASPPFVTSTYTPPPAAGTTTPDPTAASGATPSATPFVVPSGRDPSAPVTLSPTSATAATATPLPTVPTRSSGPVAAVSDVGLRDPVQFPRPDGLERQRFDTRSGSTRVDEGATYTTKRDFDALVKDYEAMATTAGWTQTSRSESGSSPTDRMLMTYWVRDGAEADLRIYGRATGVEVSLLVSVPRAAKKE